ETRTPPLLSPARHNVVEGQDTDQREAASTLSMVHAAVPPVGLVEVSTLPLWSTATHNWVEGQETPFRPARGSIFITDHAAAPPVGLVDVNTLPALPLVLVSTATHRLGAGQDMPSNWPVWSLLANSVQSAAPPVGAVEVRMLLLRSIAIQRVPPGRQ